MAGKIQKANLFKLVDELSVTQKTLLEGCQLLMKTNTQLGIRCDNLDERINIANKRIRRLEEAIQRIMPR